MIEIKKTFNKQLVLAFVLVLICFLIAVKALSSITTIIFDERYVVCIDAGHGGNDAGATYSQKSRLEKDDNLRLSLLVKQELEKENVKVVMTREDDVQVSLKERCKKANKARADLFVSLHRNSSSDGTGMEVWIKDRPSDKEKQLAKSILNELVDSSSLLNRGVKQGYRDTSGNNYYVNANTNMPSCLVEVGFISNSKDNENFDKNIEKYAKAIAKGILENLRNE